MVETEKAIRTIPGRINHAGGIVFNPTGRIAECNSLGDGRYLVRFAARFRSVPTVVVTQYFPGGNEFSSKGGSTLDNAVVVAADNDQVLIKTGDDSGNGVGREFAFIAIGEV